MTEITCGLFENCLAPLCPLDKSSLKGIWYSDEEICRSRTHGNLAWIRAQRKIARVKAGGYFTLEMLADIRTARKGMTGLDPNEEEQAQLRRWIDLHARKRTDGREKALPAMAGKAGQPDLFSQGVAAPKAGFRPRSKTWRNRGVKVKIHAETGGPSTPTGAGRVNPRAEGSPVGKARRRNELFAMTNQGKEIKKSGPEASASLKRYYRLHEVAAYFDISERTVYRLLDEGDLQATRIRKCLRVSAEEIRRYAASLEEEMDQ